LARKAPRRHALKMPSRWPSAKLMVSEVRLSSSVQMKPERITEMTEAGNLEYEMPRSPRNNWAR
jgi:hypothetical protein